MTFRPFSLFEKVLFFLLNVKNAQHFLRSFEVKDSLRGYKAIFLIVPDQKNNALSCKSVHAFATYLFNAPSDTLVRQSFACLNKYTKSTKVTFTYIHNLKKFNLYT